MEEKFCYPADTIGARGDTADSAITRIRCGWSKFRDLMPLLASRGLPFQAKCRLYSACVCWAVIYGG